MRPWPMVPLREVIQLQRRWLTLQPTETYREIGIRSFGNGIFHKSPVEGSTLGNKRVLRIEPGDLVFNNVFAWEGAVGVAGPAEAGMIGSHRFVTYTVDPKKSTPEFLKLFFTTEQGREILLKASPGSAGRNKTLGLDRFISHSIPLPAVAEQRRLVERIDALAAKVEEAKQLREEATSDRDRLLVCMAHRGDMSDAERENKGWTRTELGKVIRLVPDPVKVETTTDYPNLGIYSFGRGLFEKPPIEGMTTSAATLFRVRAGQFIYSRLFAFEGAYGIVPLELDQRFVSNEYPTFDCDRQWILPEFLEAYFKHPQLWQQVAIGSKGLGDRRQRVHPEQVLAHVLWLPPLSWQQTIADTRTRLAQQHAHFSAIDYQLNAMLPAILDRAFRGEL